MDLKIQIRNLSKSFGKKHVLQGLSLDIPAGKSMVVIGGSGTGKSVLLKCVLGLLQPDSGEILIDGQNICRIPFHKRQKLMRRFGMLFQGGALFDSLPVWKNIAFATKGLSLKEQQDLAIEKLKAVGLSEDTAFRFPAELSGGMQKRVGLARAIALNPEILFFDEPTTGLDPIMSNVINDLIRKSVKELGATALSITHDMNSVKRIADEVAMLYEGKILWTGDVRDMQHTENAHVRQFINGFMDGPIPVAL